MPTVNSQGTLTATGGEDTVVDLTTNKWFSGYVDLQLMDTGDTTILRMYLKVRTGSTLAVFWAKTYVGPQTNKRIIYFAPFPSDIEYKITLEQTDGVNRNYDYKFYEAWEIK